MDGCPSPRTGHVSTVAVLTRMRRRAACRVIESSPLLYSSGVSHSEHPQWEFDVALSFAAEDRQYVQRVAEMLKGRQLRVFYDEYMSAHLWGTDLYVVLDDVYRKRARFALVFVSASYVSKPWTRHERRSIQARALEDLNTYVLPVRLDNSELPGFPPTIGYFDARTGSIDSLVDMVVAKVGERPGTTVAKLAILRSPRNAEQQRELLARRPAGWEYLLFAGALLQKRNALETKWLDHEIGYAPRLHQYLDRQEAAAFLSGGLNDMRAVAHSMMRLFDERAQLAAFGAPGAPGDPTRIEHLAARLIAGYEQLMECAARIRGLGVPDELQPACELAARMADQPLQDIRLFVDDVVREIDRLPEVIESGIPTEVNLTLNLTMDDTLVAEFSRALQRVRNSI